MSRVCLFAVLCASAAALQEAPLRLAPAVTRRRGAAGLVVGAAFTLLPSARALEPKLKLGNAALAEMVTADLVERQFLATADFTRALYDESATFTDEVDSYSLEKFISGTKKLFVADRSKVNLTSPVVVTDESATFRFEETLAFNLPLVKPIVSLSGKVVLTRDATTGLFVAYREYWDQTPFEVVKTAHL
ncbi:hypothetical protein M885DRAFT_545437 [Pelagophyceae sp. CCMP2097]|nr:hypothetical protein M885DRAFT_545437 [Pelagophyceae sp. CCMP2097]